DLQQASKEAADIYNRLKGAVQKLSLADAEFTTTESKLEEVREWEKDRQVSKGFRARMGLRVATSQTQRLGEVTQIGAREGAREIGELELFLSSEKSRAEKMACLDTAAKDARERAEKLAGALGARVGEVLKITENWQDRPQPRP